VNVKTKNVKPSAYTDLQLQIDTLTKEKSVKENEIKIQFTEIITKANPINIFKEYIQGITADKDLELNVSKIGLNLGTNFLIEKILGRNRSIKGFLSSMLVERFSSSLINKLITKHQHKTTK
jgi:hypothetical protein